MIPPDMTTRQKSAIAFLILGLALLVPAFAVQKITNAKAFDPKFSENVTVGTAIIRNSFEGGTIRREVRVVVSDNKHGASLVECCYIVENGKGEQRVLLAGQANCPNKDGTFDFRIETRDKVAGWFVRLINDGRVVAAAGSNDKFKDLAANPAKVQVQYGAK